MSKRLLSLLSLLLFFIAISIASNGVWKPEVQFFSFPNSELSVEEITDVFVDQKGLVWMVSFNSIIKYNGKEFEKLKIDNLQHASFIRMNETSNGIKYVYDYEGALYLIDEDKILPYKFNSILKSYNTKNAINCLEYNSDSTVYFSFNRSGHFYTIKKNGMLVNLFDKNGLKTKGASLLLRGNRMPIYFGGKKNSIAPRNEVNNRQHILNEGWECVAETLLVVKDYYYGISIVKLSNNNYLFSNGRNSLIEFNNKGIVKHINYPVPCVRLFCEDDGGVWIGTKGEGIHYFPNGNIDFEKRMEIIPNSTSMVSGSDYQGGLWLYSDEYGLGYISNKYVEFLEELEGRDLGALSVFNNKLYVAEGETLLSLNVNQKVRSDLDKHVFNSEITDLKFDEENNSLWIARRGGLSYLNNANSDSIVLDELYTFKGQLMSFASNQKFSHTAVIQRQWFNFDNDSIIYNPLPYPFRLYDILYHDYDTLVNSIYGLYHYKNGHISKPNNSLSYFESPLDQLVEFKEGVLLNDRNQGIFFYKNEELRSIKLKDSFIKKSDLVIENDTTFWAFSKNGSFEVSYNIDLDRFKVTPFQELPHVSLTDLFVEGDNLYFIANNKGVARISLSQIRKKPIDEPLIHILKCEVGEKVFFSDSELGSFNYNENEVDIWYQGLDYQNLNLVYQYRLIGLTNEWKESKETYVNYSTLPAGNYTFEVQAKLGQGNWSESQIIKFQIESPYWQKWWFISGVLLAAVIVVYLVVKQVITRVEIEKNLTIQKLEAEQKALRAQMNPHFVSNIVSSVQFLILDGKYQLANDFLYLFSNLSRKVFNYSSEDLICLKDEIKFLKDYIKIEQIRFESTLDFSVIIGDGIIADKELVPPFLIQPLVENAIIHGLKDKEGEKKIALTISKEENSLLVKVFDNGNGFSVVPNESDLSKPNEKHSVEILKERLNMINGTTQENHINIESHFNDQGMVVGTTVSLKIKSFIE